MRRDISLDPDFIPWERGVVRLRKKRKPPVWFILAFVVAALGFGVYQKESARRATATQPVVADVAPTQVAPTVEFTVCMPPTGQPGYLTLSYNDGCAVTRIPCSTYTLGERSGETVAGPVIAVNLPVRMTCDGTALEFP